MSSNHQLNTGIYSSLEGVEKQEKKQHFLFWRLTNELIKQGIEVKQTVSQLPKKVELDQKNKTKRQETQKSDSTDVNESSMSGKFRSF